MPTWSKLSPNLLMASSWSGLSALDELTALMVLLVFSLVSWHGDCPGKEEPMTPVPVKT